MEIAIFGLFISAVVPAFIAKNKGRSFGIWYLYGLCFFIFAFIHSIVIKPNENAEGMSKCSKCSSIIPTTATVCPFCRNGLLSPNNPEIKYDGEFDLDLREYQLFLTRKFNIEKNNTLEKYIVGDNVFDTLEYALNFANEKHKKTEEEKIYNEKVKKESLEKTRIDNKIKLEIEKAKLASIRESNRVKYFIWSGAFILILAGFSIYSINNQRIETEKRELAERMEASLLLEESKKQLRLEKKIKIELKDMFSKGNFFGLNIGENNIEKLHELAGRVIIRKQPFADHYFVAECKKDECGDIFSKSSIQEVLKSVSFLYCVPDDKQSKGNEFYRLMGIKIKFLDNIDFYEYKNFIENNNYLPTPPKDVIQKVYAIHDLELTWKKNGQTGTAHTSIADICGNVRGFNGYKVPR